MNHWSSSTDAPNSACSTGSAFVITRLSSVAMNIGRAVATSTSQSGLARRVRGPREAAATAVFGAKTYVGTTTDEVARAAGVSQPYVVRLFGTKEKLFIEVVQRAYARLIAEFRQALPGTIEGRRERMGTAYTGLLAERGLLAVIANSTALGGEPEIGRVARAGFSDIWRLLRDEAGFT